MLRTTPRHLRLLTRHALRQPPAPLPAAHQQLRTTAVRWSPPCPLGASRSRLSQAPQWRAFHTTPARCSDEKPPGALKRLWIAYNDFFGKRMRPEWNILDDGRMATYERVDQWEYEKYLLPITLVAVLGYLASVEIPKLLPVRTNPNYLLKESLEIINKHPEVASRLGTPITGQGERVFSWHPVESVKIKGVDDQPSRLRIKYYLTGPNGTATVFAEVLEGTAEGEYNYLVVQFDDTKQVVPIIDHRDIGHKTDHDTPPRVSKSAHEAPPKVSKVLSDLVNAGGRSARS